MNDYIVSLIRTYVPVGVGLVLTWLARKLGIVLDGDTSVVASTVAVALVSAAYYAAVRALEAAYPAVGRVLLAIGLTSKAPVYRKVIQGRVER